jgi:FkbM family methyltransferase
LYKFKESKVKTNQPLTALERDFYLKLRSTLQGEKLVVYDIGAANGVVTGCLMKLENVAAIYAFEPIPDVYKQLENYTKSSKKVNCYNIALGDTNGSTLMYVSSKSDSSSILPMANVHVEQFPGTETQSAIDVRITRLDDFVKDNSLPLPDVVKIDVQGFEKNVIDGGINTISKSKYCILEMSLQLLYAGTPLFDEVYQLMVSLGFRLIAFSNPLTGKSGTQLQVDGIFENRNS